MPFDISKLRAGLPLLGALLAIAIFAPSASAACTTGGLTPAEVDICTPTAKAKLLSNGELVPPRSAPERIKAVIEAANKIRTKPYVFGGGHGRWWDRGYDCSGSVSFALHGGEFLDSPLPSTSMEDWGLAGKGRWITVYSNPGHAYAVIAGVRWDTSGGGAGESGPRWRTDVRGGAGFTARHPAGF